MKPPEGFTNEEYEVYTRCVGKLVPGDDVEMYIHQATYGYFVPSRHISNMSEVVKVGAYHHAPLLVSNNPCIGFWMLNSSGNEFSDPSKHIPDIWTYRYAYWMYNGDVRVKRIIKAV